jgi:3-hydroxybutyryl-CoA dehydratase
MSPKTLTSLNNYYDDISVGDRFSATGRTLTEKDLDIFSELSGDHAALHTDAEWAAKGPFGQKIAHGTLTLALATGLEFSLLGNVDLKVIAFYGLDRVRFVKPLFIGDTITLEGEITSMEDKDEHRGVVTIHQEIKKQDGTVVAVLDKRLLLMKKSYPAAHAS